MKFCTACQAMREEAGGTIKRGRSWSRWICKSCIEHRSESPYKSTGNYKTNVEKLMRQVYGRTR